MNKRLAAKYPFLPGAADFIDSSITLEVLNEPAYAKILKRSEERVKQTIIRGRIEPNLTNIEAELMSYPISNFLVSAIGTDFLRKRHALAEAVRAKALLIEENDLFLYAFAKHFDWTLKRINMKMDSLNYKFNVHFVNYLKNAASFRSGKWKLVNRLLEKGFVCVTKNELVRLLQEEIRRSIETIEIPKVKAPAALEMRLAGLKKLYEKHMPKIAPSDLPKQVVFEALPPCITHAFNGLKAGKRLGHMDRFALTSFFVHSGMTPDAIVNLFTSVTDFDESFTRYQVEHIAGVRGGRVKYTPPKCETLKTHGVCHEPDKLCIEVRHPLSYYRRKIREGGKNK